MNHTCLSNMLIKNSDSVTFRMPRFSYYHRSGKVWHSPMFCYRNGYKMCLAVYANGVEEGAGTHVSLSLLLLKGEYDKRLKWPTNLKHCNLLIHYPPLSTTSKLVVYTCILSIPCPARNELKEIEHESKFCPLESGALKIVDSCLTLKLSLFNECWI